MLKVKDLYKSIENTPVLKGINMHIPRGSIYGLVGANGSGKTTLIRAISGGYRYEEGELLLDGTRIYENPDVKSHIAYVPDEVFFGTTDTLNSLKLLYKNVYINFDENLYQKLLSEFDGINPKKLIRSFSKGMQRQAAIIMALSTRPKLILLDEPMDGLDPIIRRKVLRVLVEDVESNQMSVLISSHNLRELEDVCDRVGMMKDGKIILEQSLDSLQSNVIKLQIAFETEDFILPKNINLLHKESQGRIHNLILQGDKESTLEYFRGLSPVIFDVLPMTLEEIFIYEIGGDDLEDK